MPWPCKTALTAGKLVIIILIGSLVLTACSAPPAAPVSDRDQPPSRRIQVHRVAAGETLYSIAWRYGLDYRELARINGISSSYTIYPGQRLRLSPSAQRRDPPPDQVVSRPAPEPTPPAQPPTQPSSDRSERRTEEAAPAAAPDLLRAPPQWRWPTRGPVLAGFGSNNTLNRGIDIGGDLGQPIHAAADGQIVYAGSGLRGYGKLLIIKHNDTYLSAYAHNRRLLVEEGDSIKAGQRIAEMGSSGAEKIMLHFEIRRDGTPVDPMGYLPRR